MNSWWLISWQTLNVDSTLIYVEITSWRRSTWYPHWFNVDLSTLIHQQSSTLKQRWFWVDSKNNFVLISWRLKNYNLYINVEQVAVFQRQNNVRLSTSNQCRNLMLKQCWFWVDSKSNFVFISWSLKIKIFILTLKRQPYFKFETTSLYQH